MPLHLLLFSFLGFIAAAVVVGGFILVGKGAWAALGFDDAYLSLIMFVLVLAFTIRSLFRSKKYGTAFSFWGVLLTVLMLVTSGVSFVYEILT